MFRSFLKVSKKNFSSQKHITLPKLDYGYGDLEPVLSKENLELHHSKHHQRYVDNYNKLIDTLEQAQQKGDVEKVVELTPKLKFNGGSHICHSLYWKMLAPVKSNLYF
jgi:Fe-Mn family superoxide dismutase